MRCRLAIAAGLALATGCRVVDAPAAFEDLVVFGFVHFADEPAYPEAVVAMMLPMTETLEDDLLEGCRVSALTTEDLHQADIDAVIDHPVLGSAAQVWIDADLDDVAWAWSYPHMDDVLSATLDFDVTAEHGDRDCFLAHECETYAYDATRVTDLGFFGTNEQIFRREFRWTVDPFGAPVLTVRDLVPDSANLSTSFVKIEQQYAYAVLAEQDGGTQRVEAFWSEIRVLGMDVPDYFALQTVVNAMNEAAEDLDAFIARTRP